MFNSKLQKLFQKIKEVEGNRKALAKIIEKTKDWQIVKKLINKDSKLYNIWYRRTNKISYLLKIKVNSR